jgi:hypothetical protein
MLYHIFIKLNGHLSFVFRKCMKVLKRDPSAHVKGMLEIFTVSRALFKVLPFLRNACP